MTVLSKDKIKELSKTPENAKILADAFLTPAPDYKPNDPAYICPKCGNGSGQSGTGIHFIPNTGTLKCFGACSESFDLIEAIKIVKNQNYTDAIEEIANKLGYEVKQSKKSIPKEDIKKEYIKIYQYKKPYENLTIFEKRRFKEINKKTGEIISPKRFSGWDPNNNCGPTEILSKEEQSLIYNATAVEEAKKKGQTVYFVEGEKDADNLANIGITATTIYQTTSGLNEYHLDQLKGIKKLVLIPDYDYHGIKFADKAFRPLKKLIEDFYILEWNEGTKQGYDVSDFLINNEIKSKEQFISAISNSLTSDFPENYSQMIEEQKEKSINEEEPERIIKNGKDITEFVIFNKNGSIKKPFDSKIRNHIKDNYKIITLGTDPYIYYNGVYSNNLDIEISKEKTENITGTNLINREIEKLIPEELITVHNRTNIRKLILEDTFFSDQELADKMNNYPDHYISFANGMYNLKTGQLEKHDPDYYCFNQNPHSIDPEKVNTATLKDCPIFSNVISEMLDDTENEKMFLDYFSVCLTKAKIQQFLIVTGEPGAGKSMLLNLIQKIIGKRNISNISIQDLSERFKTAELFGKQLNIYADLPNRAIDRGDMVKMLFGSDLMTAENKYEKPFNFVPYAKGIFTTNRIPNYTDEKSGAFYRRMLILRVKQKGTHVEDIEKKLDAEIPEILHYLVRHLQMIYKNTIKIEESTASARERAIVRGNTDSLIAFINNCISRDYRNTSPIPKPLVFEYYKIYCRAYGRKPLGKINFYRELEENKITFYKNQNIFLDSKFTLVEFEEFNYAKINDSLNQGEKIINEWYLPLEAIFNTNEKVNF